MLWTCIFLVREKDVGPTIGAAVRGLSSGLALLFRNLASAIDRVLIFPYRDSLTMCLFTVVIVSEGQGLGTILSETGWSGDEFGKGPGSIRMEEEDSPPPG